MLKKEEGGRHTPFFNGYRPQFYFRTTDVTGTVTLPAGTEMVMPGDNIKVDVELVSPIACEEGLRFAIREGGKTVGAGVVTKILAEAVARRRKRRPPRLLRSTSEEVRHRYGPGRTPDHRVAAVFGGRRLSGRARIPRDPGFPFFRLLLAWF